MGAVGTRPSLRPLFVRERELINSSDALAPREGEVVSYEFGTVVASFSDVIPAKAGIQYAAAS
jgi:hypothetical protein